MFNHTNFFAIVALSGTNSEIRRIHLSQDAQNHLCQLFSRAAQDFLAPNLERIGFDGRYNPEEGEIQVIANFPIPPEITMAIQEPTAVDELIITEENLPSIKGIFTGVPGQQPLIAIQKFNKGQYLARKGVSLIRSGNLFTRITSPGLNISEKIDALISNGNLLFFSFWNVRQILNLSTYYREATDVDLSEFANHSTIYISDPEVFSREADDWVRKKIGFLRDSGTLERYSPRLVAEKAAEYGVPLGLRNNGIEDQLVLPVSKKDLKEALRFLDEDYFSGPLTEIKYLSNSKRRVAER